MIAALYVETDGCYYGLPEVDPWDEARDARLYAGTGPVVAHPPCARWGRYYAGGPSWIAKGNPPKKLGDDGGCFAAALAAVRRFGGVLEHPMHSQAWGRHGIKAPPTGGGWIVADLVGGWTCCVDQKHYGHRATKPTWLYYVGPTPPPLTWGKAPVNGKGTVKRGELENLSRKQRLATPEPFRDLLLSLAKLSDSPDGRGGVR